MTTVLHIINSFEPGGAEVLLSNFALKFEDTEYEIILTFFKGNGTLLKDSSPKCKIYNLSKNGSFTFLSIFKLIEIIKNNQVKIVHTHDPQSGIIGRLISLLLGIKNIVTTRHIPDLLGSHKFIYFVENIFLRYGKCVIAVSDAVKQRLIKTYKIKETKIIMIHNGIDISSFTRQNRLGKKVKKIGTVSRLIHEKGNDVLIKAFYEIKKIYPDCVLEIVGEGIERKNLELLTKSLALENSVHFEGPLMPWEIKKFLASTDIFVLASRHEGFGLSIIEAMSMNIPVIASNVDGIPEIIKHFDNGLLFENENVSGLVDCLLCLISNNKLRNLIAQRARETVEINFDLSYNIEKIKMVYKNLSLV